jgi:hypothetical protein
MEEFLPSKYKVLSSNPSTEKGGGRGGTKPEATAYYALGSQGHVPYNISWGLKTDMTGRCKTEYGKQIVHCPKF